MSDTPEHIEQITVYRHKDGHYSVYTEALIAAPAADVWATLADFDHMADWSSTLKGIIGDRRDGGKVQSQFYTMGRIWLADHTFIYKEGQEYGWSDPLTGEFEGVRDHHLFRVQAITPTLTRFIQSDEFTGENAAKHGVALARVGLDGYPVFNSELRGEVLRRIKK
ncbi:MAG: SRPBCC family protein [Paracoccus sp. (in: a-proteobacteria)]|uniref:SRPBCC family protein n=1 Tax=Paracoccus sp. TaxID=267 RepID=UPI0026DF0AC5|nr:SRPBCC family protein [Paracoccus sp. (in: a-proteobacteria)]MDO5633242.1 SRPBCC family protein [Paracoccus sp. (in: a-proteobacteria)]